MIIKTKINILILLLAIIINLYLGYFHISKLVPIIEQKKSHRAQQLVALRNEKKLNPDRVINILKVLGGKDYKDLWLDKIYINDRMIEISIRSGSCSSIDLYIKYIVDSANLQVSSITTSSVQKDKLTKSRNSPGQEEDVSQIPYAVKLLRDRKRAREQKENEQNKENNKTKFSPDYKFESEVVFLFN